jgi:FeS assembly SUF system protein
MHEIRIFACITEGKLTMENQEKMLENRIVDALKQVYDPEIPVNIYDLGLVYELTIDPESNVLIRMTLTAPNCPVAEDMPGIVRDEVRKVEGVKEVVVELVFDPPWDQSRISEAALLDLGLL